MFIYNGRNLFVPRALQNPLMTLVTINPATDAPVEVRFELKRHRRMVECIFIYNLLFRKIMYILEMKRINRSNFDPRHPQLIPQHKLEIWPGYVTAIDEYNGGLLLCLDCCFKVAFSISIESSSKENEFFKGAKHTNGFGTYDLNSNLTASRLSTVMQQSTYWTIGFNSLQ